MEDVMRTTPEMMLALWFVLGALLTLLYISRSSGAGIITALFLMMELGAIAVLLMVSAMMA